MLNEKQVQEVCLHCTKFNDMATEKWLSAFKTEELLEVALTGGGRFYIEQLSSNGEESMRNLAMSALKRQKGILDGTIIITDESSPKTTPPEFITASDVVHSSGPQVSTNPPLFTNPLIFLTEKGKFKSLGVLKSNLEKLYPFISTMGQIMEGVLTEGFELPQGVDYLGEPTYTRFIRAMKSELDDLQIEALGGEVEGQKDTEPSDPPFEEEQPKGTSGAVEEAITVGVRDVRDVTIFDLYPEYLYPYELVDSNEQSPPQKFKTFKEAQKEQKLYNATLNKDDPKLKAKKRKGEK
jgi:hypothetical protein